MVAYVGRTPTSVVAVPTVKSAMTRVGLRPNLSPNWPNSMPPIGRAIKPTAAVLNEASTAATSLAPGKNRGPKTRAAAVR
jgi:hypothetical protein